MRFSRKTTLATAALAVLITVCACSSDDDGNECDRCSSDSDCKEGLTCELFCCFGPSRVPLERCATSSTQECGSSAAFAQSTSTVLTSETLTATDLYVPFECQEEQRLDEACRDIYRPFRILFDKVERKELTDQEYTERFAGLEGMFYEYKNGMMSRAEYEEASLMIANSKE